MRKRPATWIAHVVYLALVRVLVRRSDAEMVRLLTRVRRVAMWLGRSDDELVVLDDLIAIFGMGPEATAVARRFILEADPDQFRAVVRGALWD